MPRAGSAGPGRVRQLAEARGPGSDGAPAGAALSVKEVAARIRRTERAVRHMVARRTIPFRKVGGKLLFFEDEIARWLAEAPGVSAEEAVRNLQVRSG